MNVSLYDSAETDDMITLAEAMVGLAHALNNSLNSMVLQASVVQLKAGEALREQAALIRQEGARAAARLRPLLRLRELRRQARRPADLNAAVRSVLDGWPELAGRVEADLAPDLPPVVAAGRELERLVYFLLRAVLPLHTAPDRPLRLRTLSGEARVQLVLDPAGPEASEERLAALLEGGGDSAGDLHGLAAESLARQLGGSTSTAGGPGGPALIVTWEDRPC